MNKASSSTTRNWQAWAWVVGLGVFALGVGIVVVLVARVVSWRSQMHQRVTARVAAMRSAGLPTNGEELSQWVPAVPDAENAAFVYTNAIGQLASGDFTDSSKFGLPRRGESLSETDRPLIVTAVWTNQATLALVHSASNLLKARYPINYSEGPFVKLPHHDGLGGRVIRLLGCEALLRAEAGDTAGASDSVQAMFHVSRSLDSEPLLMSQMLRRSMLGSSCHSLERLLGHTSLQEETLARLQEELISAEATNGLLIALIGERALSMELIRLAHEDPRRMIEILNQSQKEEDRTSVPPVNPGAGWKYVGFFERDREFYLRAMETNIIVVSHLPPSSLALTNDLANINKEASAGYYAFSTMLLPSLTSTVRRDATYRATLRTALAGVAIERWRLAHAGAIPDSLDALVPSLVPAVPPDPFDGRPLRFKKLSKGYLVYSIGPDFQDDGGTVQPQSSSLSSLLTNRFDITFGVER